MAAQVLRSSDAVTWPSVNLAFWPLEGQVPAGAAGLRAGGRALFAQVLPAFRWLPARLFVRADDLTGLAADEPLELVAESPSPPQTALGVEGEIGRLTVSSQRYRVVAAPDGSWGNKGPSGILCEIQPLFAGEPHLLKRNGTLHWGPNLKRPGDSMYTPASLGWNPAATRTLAAGPYVVEVQLAGPFGAARNLPAYPDVDVALVYRFCDQGGWFAVEMEMRFGAEHRICLLRDDEWSYSNQPFTHVVRRLADRVAVNTIPEMMAADRNLGGGLAYLGFANLDTHLACLSLRLGHRYDGPTTRVCSVLGGGAEPTANTYYSRHVISEAGAEAELFEALTVPKGASYHSRFAYLMLDDTGDGAWKKADALLEELHADL
jgi:hypothetical protein